MLVLILLATAAVSYAHGVTYHRLDQDSVAVRFSYADGEAMSYVEVKLFGPDSTPDLEYQNGRTDADGVFAYVPNAAGRWHLEAWDSMGHKCQVDTLIEKGDNGLQASVSKDQQRTPLLFKTLLGLSVISNLSLLLVYRQKQKKYLLKK